MNEIIAVDHAPEIIRHPLTEAEINAKPDGRLTVLPMGPAATVPTVRFVYWTGRIRFREDGTLLPDVRRLDVSGLTPGVRIAADRNGDAVLDTTPLQDYYQGLGWMRVDHILGHWPVHADVDPNVFAEYVAPLLRREGLEKLRDLVDLDTFRLDQIRIPTLMQRKARRTATDLPAEVAAKQTVIDRARECIRSYQAILRSVWLDEEPEKCGTPDTLEDGPSDGAEQTPPRRRGRPRKSSEGNE